MASDYVIMSINLWTEVGNDEEIVVCNFSGHRLSCFEVLEGDLLSPLQSQEAKKKPGPNGVKDRAFMQSRLSPYKPYFYLSLVSLV